nr:uncharacterized protein LOC110440139 [Danio rerio]|eukprot:XP_021335937.1 uncharacterized protein LOC110440139 [Danio rerio]
MAVFNRAIRKLFGRFTPFLRDTETQKCAPQELVAVEKHAENEAIDCTENVKKCRIKCLRRKPKERKPLLVKAKPLLTPVKPSVLKPVDDLPELPGASGDFTLPATHIQSLPESPDELVSYHCSSVRPPTRRAAPLSPVKPQVCSASPPEILFLNTEDEEKEFEEIQACRSPPPLRPLIAWEEKEEESWMSKVMDLHQSEEDLSEAGESTSQFSMVSPDGPSTRRAALLSVFPDTHDAVVLPGVCPSSRDDFSRHCSPVRPPTRRKALPSMFPDTHDAAALPGACASSNEEFSRCSPVRHPIRRMVAWEEEEDEKEEKYSSSDIMEEEMDVIEAGDFAGQESTAQFSMASPGIQHKKPKFRKVAQLLSLWAEEKAKKKAERKLLKEMEKRDREVLYHYYVNDLILKHLWISKHNQIYS